MNMFNERESFWVAITMLGEICAEHDSCDECYCSDLCEEFDYIGFTSWDRCVRNMNGK